MKKLIVDIEVGPLMIDVENGNDSRGLFLELCMFVVADPGIRDGVCTFVTPAFLTE